MDIKCEYTEMVDINLLTENPKNPNKHDEKQIAILAKNIKYQGWRHPIIVSKLSGFIAAGHGRLAAAKSLGIQTAPVDYQDFENEADEFRFMVADNKIASLAVHDDVAMLEGMKDLDLLDTDLELLGLDDFLIPLEEDPEKEAKEDELPDTDGNEFGVKLGDIYQLGEHRLMCGDSTDEETVSKLMNGEKADMVFTDPPYGIKEEGDRTKRNGKNSLKKGVEYKSFVDDSIEYAIKAFDLVQNLTPKTQIWWGANYYCHSIPQTNNWLVWDKRVEDKQKDFNSDCELAYVDNGKQSVRIFRHLWKGLIKGSEHGQARVHPTQKPIALAEWCFENYGKPESVLDLFLGSGSTLIACEKTNRKCYGMELDPHYCSVIIKRWQEYSGKTARLLS